MTYPSLRARIVELVPELELENRPTLLSDVLRAMLKSPTCDYEACLPVLLGASTDTTYYWDLSKPLLSDQSPEVWEFIAELLK